MKISFEPSLYNLYKVHELVKNHVEKLILDEFSGVVSSESVPTITANLFGHGQEDWCVQWDSQEEVQEELLKILNNLLGVCSGSSWKVDFWEGSLVLRHAEPVKSGSSTDE